MLQKLRDKTSGWIAAVVLGLLTIPFAFFGMEQYMFQQNQTFAAKVEAPPSWWHSAPSWWPVRMLWQSEEISAEDFRLAFEQARQQQRQALGERFDPRTFETLDNKRKALDTLIDQAVLRMTAANAGITVSDAQVRETIQSMEGFQVEGKFDPQRYQLMLASQSPPLTPRGFEQRVREGLQQSLVVSQLVSSAFVTPSETQTMMRLLGERRDVSLVMLPEPASDTAPVSDAEAQKWYDTHKSDYRLPEMVSIEYVDINSSELPALAAVDEAALRARYEKEKARFVDPEQRLASHILISVDPAADEATRKAAEAKAIKLAAEARQPGADFAAIARANSEDTGSKASGGDLGWVAKDVMVPAFESALFAMQPGEISAPVKSEFGWHVIQLREVKSGQQTSFDDARAELEREEGESSRERRFNELTGKLVDQVLKNPTALAPAARVIGLPVSTAGPFARGGGGGISANPAVVRAAFTESLIQDGTVSDPIEIAPEHSVVLRVTRHTPESQQTLAQVKERVIAEVRGDRMNKAVQADADAMIAKLRAGETIESLATARGLALQAVPNVPRGAPMPDAAVNEAYFQVPAPADGKVSPGKASYIAGTMVFAVTKVTPGDPAEATEQDRTSFRQNLGQVVGNEDATALLEAQRKQMKITVVEDRL